MRAWIVLLRLKYCLKYWGHRPCWHFLTSLKTDLRRRSSNVGHLRTSIACLPRTVVATILAARFWRASRSSLQPSLQQSHTLTQYSKTGLIRLQYTTFALSLVRLLRSLPSIPTRFPAFEIRYFICSFQLRRSSKTIPR